MSVNTNNIDINDKYLLASILQKSIRRANTNWATYAVKKLFDIDKNYLTYRMMIIAFEDVGIAHFDLMTKITSYRWGVRNFKSRQIDFCTYFEELAKNLCESQKDRTACDATYLLALAYQKRDLDSVFSSAPVLKDIYDSWNILGFKRYALADKTSEEEDRLDDYVNFVEKKLGKSCDYLTNFYSTQVDPFFLATPFLYNDYQLNKTVVSHEIIIQSDDFPWSAIDGHNRIGSACIRQFIQSYKNEINAIFSSNIDDALIYDIFKKCLFRAEGQTVDPKIDYPSATQIKKTIQHKEWQYFFPQISWNEYISMAKLIKNNLSHLNEIRARELVKTHQPVSKLSL